MSLQAPPNPPASGFRVSNAVTVCRFKSKKVLLIKQIGWLSEIMISPLDHKAEFTEESAFNKPPATLAEAVMQIASVPTRALVTP
jgi:hypothetical protein